MFFILCSDTRRILYDIFFFRFHMSASIRAEKKHLFVRQIFSIRNGKNSQLSHCSETEKSDAREITEPQTHFCLHSAPSAVTFSRPGTVPPNVDVRKFWSGETPSAYSTKMSWQKTQHFIKQDFSAACFLLQQSYVVFEVQSKPWSSPHSDEMEKKKKKSHTRV